MNTVDRLIRTREKIAKLKKEEAELAKELKEMGLGVYRGSKLQYRLLKRARKNSTQFRSRKNCRSNKLLHTPKLIPFFKS